MSCFLPAKDLGGFMPRGRADLSPTKCLPPHVILSEACRRIRGSILTKTACSWPIFCPSPPCLWSCWVMGEKRSSCPSPEVVGVFFMLEKLSTASKRHQGLFRGGVFFVFFFSQFQQQSVKIHASETFSVALVCCLSKKENEKLTVREIKKAKTWWGK